MITVLIELLRTTAAQKKFLYYALNTENHLGNIDLEEVELIYVEVTYAPKDFSDDFREFAEFNLEGLNMDNESLDAAAGLDLFYF